jgi:hypothetical protein
MTAHQLSYVTDWNTNVMMLVALIHAETMLFVLLKITKLAVNVPLVSDQIPSPMLNVHQLKLATQMFVTRQQSVKQQTVDHYANVHQTTLEIPTLLVVVCKLKEIVLEETWIAQLIPFVKKENVSILVKVPVEQTPYAKSLSDVPYAHAQKSSLH